MTAGRFINIIGLICPALQFAESTWHWRRNWEPYHLEQLTRNPPSLILRSLRNKQLKAKLLRSFGQRSDLLLSVPGFIIFGSFVNVGLSVFDEPVKEAGELASHGGNGLGSSQPGAQSTVLRAQITLASQ